MDRGLMRKYRKQSYLFVNIVTLLLGALMLASRPFDAAVALALGTSLISAGIVGLLFVYHYRIELSFDEARRVYEEWGILDVRPDRSDEGFYRALLSSCRERLDVQALSLSRFYSDFSQELAKLASDGIPIRLLVLDPHSQIMKIRIREEGTAEASNLASRTEETAHAIRDLRLPSLMIRYYTCMPHVNYVRIDSKAFLGPYLAGKPSRSTVTLFCDAEGKLASEFEKHFETVWDKFSIEVQ